MAFGNFKIEIMHINWFSSDFGWIFRCYNNKVSRIYSHCLIESDFKNTCNDLSNNKLLLIITNGRCTAIEFWIQNKEFHSKRSTLVPLIVWLDVPIFISM